MPERAAKPRAPGKHFHEIESYSNDDTPLRAYVLGCLKYGHEAVPALLQPPPTVGFPYPRHSEAGLLNLHGDFGFQHGWQSTIFAILCVLIGEMK